EGLELLARYWSGEPVTHEGRFYQVRDVTLLPSTIQQPRPPVWIGGDWAHPPPPPRAAPPGGAVPPFPPPRPRPRPPPRAAPGRVPRVGEVGEPGAYIQEHRAERTREPFDVVLGGATPGDPSKARDVVGPLAEAGATWWDERQWQTSDDVYRIEPVLRRVG